jgi:hypothetical protein
VAFLAFGTADVLYRDAIHSAGIQIAVKMLVNAVKLVAIPRGIREIDFRSTVAIDTPTHAQRGELVHFIHLLDRTMAGLTLHFTGFGMLGMAEEDMVGKIMDLYPFDRLGIFRVIGARFRIVANVAV